MGGLRKKLKVTHWTFLIACLAISGIPPFSGFFSKEEILLAAFHSSKIIFWIAVFTSGLTAFYMFRLFFYVFYRKEESHSLDHGHEGSPGMLLPLVLLAIGAIAAGFIPFGKFISSDFYPLESHVNLSFSALPVGLSVVGILFSYFFFKKENPAAIRWSEKLGRFFITAKHKFYIDEIYLFVTKKIIFKLIAIPAAWIDKNIVDGFMNLLARITEVFSVTTAGFQSGKLQSYAAWMLVGVLAIFLLIIYMYQNSI